MPILYDTPLNNYDCCAVTVHYMSPTQTRLLTGCSTLLHNEPMQHVQNKLLQHLKQRFAVLLNTLLQCVYCCSVQAYSVQYATRYTRVLLHITATHIIKHITDDCVFNVGSCFYATNSR